MSNPRISVIVPIFNVQDYLRECLSSLAAQTFGRSPLTADLTFEVILVDDGSTDGSRAIAEEFVAAQRSLPCTFVPTLITKPNAGVAQARRDGLAAATGEWLAFVDSDDWLDPRYLELLYLKGIESGSEIVACGLVRTAKKGAQSTTIPPIPTRAGTFLQDPRFAINTYPVLWNKLWRSSLIDGWLMAGGEFPSAEILLGEDIAITYAWAAGAGAVSWILDGLYFYRIREGSGFFRRWTDPVWRRSIHLAISHLIQESIKLGVLDRYYNEFANVCVLHLIRSNPEEFKSAMMGDSAAEQYCVAALSLLNRHFPDWAEIAAESEEERQTFIGLQNALVLMS